MICQKMAASDSDFGMPMLVSKLCRYSRICSARILPEFSVYGQRGCLQFTELNFLRFFLVRNLPIQRSLEKTNNLFGWAKQLYREKRGIDILYPVLVTHASGDVELFHYLQIASQCLDDQPFKRPTMIQVMDMFKELGKRNC